MADREGSPENAGETFPLRLQGSIYALAFFTGNMTPIAMVILPLWALRLEESLFLIGLMIASRQFLPVTLSIHGGALMDRFQPRTVILTAGLVGSVATFLYPFFPFMAAVIILQIITGFTEVTSWIGTQSMVGRYLKGYPVYAGRMTASARFGGFFAPLLAGLAWQFLGPIGAFTFSAAWVLCGVASTLFIPKVIEEEADDRAGNEAGLEIGFSVADVLPKLSDYKTTFKLLLIPMVGFVIAATFMRSTGSGIQGSFYSIWLQEIGITAGTIGFLIGLSNLVSAFAAFGMRPLTNRIRAHWLLLVTVALAIAAIAVTPLLEGIVILAIFISLRGVGQGLNLPLMITILARAVGRDSQGRVAALRVTFNRSGSLVIPIIMGAIAEVAGLEWAFYSVGIAGTSAVLIMALWASRQPEFR